MLLQNLTWPEVQALSRETPVVFPIAALEQHGSHLPFFTDTMLVGEIARRAEEELGGRALLAPVQWLGNSHHHLDFSGTLSAEPRVYLDLLGGLLENFLAHGFRRLLLLNGHGGNDVPGRQAIFEVRQRHRSRRDLLLLLATYWNLAPDAAQAHPALQQPAMRHACEWETSMMLRLAPQLVKEYSNLPPKVAGESFAPAVRAWTMTDRSTPGYLGLPNEANAEKGEALFAAFTRGAVSLLERMIAWNGSSWDE